MKLHPAEQEEWLKGLKEFDLYNQHTIMAAFAVFGIPGHYLDVGCGSGAMVRTARGLGVEAYGIDMISHPEPYFIEHDLTQPFTEYKLPECGIVTSIEVAEHLDESGADTFCDTLVKFVAPGGWLIFTAAMPGQPGHHHVNCRPAYYWREKLYARGLNYIPEQTYRLALVWSHIFTNMHHLEANLQVFRK